MIFSALLTALKGTEKEETTPRLGSSQVRDDLMGPMKAVLIQRNETPLICAPHRPNHAEAMNAFQKRVLSSFLPHDDFD